MTRRTSPAAARNLAPIVQVLREWLPERGRVLEIASGSGEHAIGFATAFPGLEWQPSDAAPELLASIDAWAAEVGPGNLLPALRLDVTDLPWPVAGPLDAIVCINMIHIAPWSACLALMRGAGELLRPDGRLYVYGAMKVGGEFTAPSNAEFDASLRSRDPSWGVRDLEAVAAAARAQGLELARTVAMPANNFSLLLRRV
jgi:SAM-dependent methyltransferase